MIISPALFLRWYFYILYKKVALSWPFLSKTYKWEHVRYYMDSDLIATDTGWISHSKSKIAIISLSEVDTIDCRGKRRCKEYQHNATKIGNFVIFTTQSTWCHQAQLYAIFLQVVREFWCLHTWEGHERHQCKMPGILQRSVNLTKYANESCSKS